MIRVNEDASFKAVKDIYKQFEDIYYEYFPKSWLYLKRYTNVGFTCTLYLGDDGKSSDPFKQSFGVILTKNEDKIKISVPIEGFRLALDDGTYRVTRTGFDNLEGLPELSIKDALAWFDDSCNKLHKLACKALRQGKIDEWWGEYL